MDTDPLFHGGLIVDLLEMQCLCTTTKAMHLVLLHMLPGQPHHMSR